MPDTIRTACCVCEEETSRTFEVSGHWIRACPSCGHRQTEAIPPGDHVASVYSDAYFTEGGAGYPDYVAEGDMLRKHGRRYARILSRHASPGRVLDVGAAAGFILQGLVDGGWSGIGVEPNDRMAAYARTELGLDVRTGALETVEVDEQFDLVSLIQVIAHFVDPSTAFRRVAELTRPSGLCLVETWNRRSLTARLFGRNWHEYSPPSVLHWFAPDDLRALAARHGFEEIARGRPKKRISGAHARSLVRHKLEGRVIGAPLRWCAALIPDRLPIPYPAEDLFWTLFRRR